MLNNDRLPDDTQVESSTENETAETEETVDAIPSDGLQQLAEQSATPIPPNKDVFALKRMNARLTREREEALTRLKEIESRQYQTVPAEQDDFPLAPDALAEGKHLSAMAKRLKNLEKQLVQQSEQTNLSIAQAHLKASYPDFDRVVSPENLEVLREAYPEIAAALNTSTDLYSKAASAYTLIKKLNIAPDYSADINKAKINAAKPRPSVSLNGQRGDTPLSHANIFAEGLTKELKAKLAKEVEDSAGGYY